MNNRIKDVVDTIVSAVQRALDEKEVTESEYRTAVHYLMEVAQQREIALLCDVFFNSTVVATKARLSDGSTPAIEGPYYRDDAPLVEDRLKSYDTDDHKPLLIQGTVKGVDGSVIENVTIDVWHSTPDGKYSGFHDDIPTDFYRGKLRVGTDGGFRVRTTMPVAYQIPNQGPTGALLETMGGHSWRPAHVHFKVNAPGYETLTTQYYFEGGDWVTDDCCNGVESSLITPDIVQDGARVMNINFVIEPARSQAGANA
ncbi:chlorocatechol 1,2-dioxygenase [Paraburkholderia phytofirmans]|uniref:Chlorocatechol 1,2-dioxygenase n=1 Tax=Paraburkholderia phytofirmans OLGA172 TaxID=1417228 RepID=W8JJE3_9BURK|nr:chlorocatechol 1,2-dioxygenase [Paraburkholderia phytofirmans]AHK61084.1 TfdC chlorocatechol 1,2-dioxygenase [Paraburkholderia phytofirmans OLGA172]ANB71786.1 catechol 1,2-dioxygenase [Paraburkholderia phytofirmans OLGA172]